MKGWKMKCWLGLGLTLLLTACATVPMALPEMDAQAKRMTPPPGKALLYVYRGFSPAGAAVVAEPVIDGQRLGGLAPKTFLVVELEPGKHLYKRGSSGIPLYAKAGDTYFIEATVSGGDAQVAQPEARMVPCVSTTSSPTFSPRSSGWRASSTTTSRRHS